MSKRLFDAITLSDLQILHNLIDEDSRILGKKIDYLLKEKKKIVRSPSPNAQANELEILNNEIEDSCSVIADLDWQLNLIDYAIRMKSSIDTCEKFRLNNTEMILITELIKRLRDTEQSSAL